MHLFGTYVSIYQLQIQKIGLRLSRAVAETMIFFWFAAL